jgi:hypothetical protein
MKRDEFARKLSQASSGSLMLKTATVGTVSGLAYLTSVLHGRHPEWTASPLRRIVFFTTTAVICLVPPLVAYLIAQSRLARKFRLECPNCRTPLVGSLGREALKNDQCPVCGIAMLLE